MVKWLEQKLSSEILVRRAQNRNIVCSFESLQNIMPNSLTESSSVNNKAGAVEAEVAADNNVSIAKPCNDSSRPCHFVAKVDLDNDDTLVSNAQDRAGTLFL